MCQVLISVLLPMQGVCRSFWMIEQPYDKLIQQWMGLFFNITTMDNTQFKQAEKLKNEIDSLREHISEVETKILDGNKKRDRVDLRMEEGNSSDYYLKLNSDFYNGLEFYELYMMRAKKALADMEKEFESL